MVADNITCEVEIIKAIIMLEYTIKINGNKHKCRRVLKKINLKKGG